MKTIICMIAYNRPEYLQEVITSLERCKGVEKYPIICSLDGGDEKNQLKNQTIMENSKLEIEYRSHEENLGCAGNMGYVLSWAFNEEGADRVIVLEDDVVVSEKALEYCSFSLDKYEDDERIFTVALTRSPHYIHHGLDGIPIFRNCGDMNTDKLKQINTNGWFMCSGWATWRRVWEEIDKEGWFGLSPPFLFGQFTYNKKWVWERYKNNHASLKGSWASPMNLYWIKGRLCIEPHISRAKNIGKQGTFTGNNEEMPTRYEDTVEDKEWIGNGKHDEEPLMESLIFPTEEEIENHYQFMQQLGGNQQ